MTAPLEIKDLSVAYGRTRVLENVSVKLEPGSIVSVIGPNGAGKTTLLLAIMGILPSRGTILYGGGSMQWIPVEERVERGLCLVPERRTDGRQSARDRTRKE